MIALSAGVAGWQAVAAGRPPGHRLPRLGGGRGSDRLRRQGAVAGYRIRVGRRIGSAALVADGLHARTDGLTSLAVVVAAVGAMAGWRLADPVVGLAISVAILNVLRHAARDIYRRLMDRVDPELVDRMDALAHTRGVQSVDRVRVRWIGHG